MPDPRRHVVFDLDGVLLDSETDLSWLDAALSTALRKLDLPDSEEHRRRLYPGRLRDLASTANDLGVPPERLWTVRNREYTREKMAAITTGSLAPFEDVVALDDLPGPKHVISNSPQTVVDAFLSRYELDDRFAVAIGRGDDLDALDHVKPTPTFYHHLVERVGASDASFVYVGDTDTDRAFARRVGMRYVHLDRDAGDSLHDVVDRLESESFWSIDP